SSPKPWPNPAPDALGIGHTAPGGLFSAWRLSAWCRAVATCYGNRNSSAEGGRYDGGDQPRGQAARGPAHRRDGGGGGGGAGAGDGQPVPGPGGCGPQGQPSAQVVPHAVRR